jgi:hypothetical protein
MIIGWSDAICLVKEYLTLKITDGLSDAKNIHGDRLSDAKSMVWRYMFLASGLTASAENWRYMFLASDRLTL